jgi:antibiotic biosynthesis monooxygenase (ABM) superfamily enzyme
MDEGRSSPTVIVSRTVRPESTDAFAAWVSRLVNAAYRHPGYVDSFVQRPTTGHPSEWTVVYRFADRASLEAWLSSPERLALLDEGEELVEGPSREQILAAPSSDGETRVVSSYRLKPGTEARHTMVHQRMLDALAGFDGFVGREVLDAVPGIQDETVVILTFDTPEHLRAWIESDTRARILGELDAITAGDLTTNVVGGFAGWFPSTPDGSEPKKWKQAAVVLLALFPVSLTLTLLRAWLLPDLPTVPSVFISNVIGIAVLTWLLMPPLTRALDDWLRR